MKKTIKEIGNCILVAVTFTVVIFVLSCGVIAIGLELGKTHSAGAAYDNCNPCRADVLTQDQKDELANLRN